MAQNVLVPTLQISLLLATWNELSHVLLSYGQLRSRIRWIQGKPLPPELSENRTSLELECTICLGAGLGSDDESPTKLKSMKGSSGDIDTDMDDTNPFTLESFCEFPTHVAHRACMFAWLKTPGSTLHCPSCRKPLILKVIREDKKSWKTLLEFGKRRLLLRNVLNRFAILVGSAFVISRFHMWKTLRRSRIAQKCLSGSSQGGRGVLNTVNAASVAVQ
jgi:hypothetical protein